MKTFLKIIKKTVFIFTSLIALLAVITFFYVRQAKFGEAPSGQRVAALGKSLQYKEGKFQNIHATPDLSPGYTMSGIIYDQLFNDHPRRNPVDVIPSVKVDLLGLSAEADVLVWFGHSSYFMQIDGMRFLVDPVFSGNASPIPGTVKAYMGTDRYNVDDLPAIDYLLISHDHYDHLDYETIIGLRDKVKTVICGLGVGAHFESWGYPSNQVIESDWNETVSLDTGFAVHTAPARHFSGRAFKRNNTLWMSYVLQTPSMKIYIGGDSGYDTHFAEIGNRFGPIDLAVLENGQYNVAWKAIHLLPEQGLQAAQDLRAQRLFPVHSSKFTLAMHAWDEPMITITKLAEAQHFPLVTPIIGEKVNLRDSTQVFTQWWKGIN